MTKTLGFKPMPNEVWMAPDHGTSLLKKERSSSLAGLLMGAALELC